MGERLVTFIRKLIGRSVFRSIRGKTMDGVFTNMFHRTAATLYALYALWGAIVVADGLPTLVNQQGSEWTTIFALFVVATAGPAALAATFFPRLAQIELYAGVSFAALLLVYLFFVLVNLWEGIGSAASTELIASVVVVPVARTAIIVWFLIQQAHERALGLRGD